MRSFPSRPKRSEILLLLSAIINLENIMDFVFGGEEI